MLREWLGVVEVLYIEIAFAAELLPANYKLSNT
jgi:hypothetical protein